MSPNYIACRSQSLNFTVRNHTAKTTGESCQFVHSYPSQKRNLLGETQLPSEGCLENTESELQELDDPGNITMKIGKTNEFPSFSTEIDLSSRLDILPPLVQETAHKEALSPLFLQVVLFLLRVFVTTSTSSPVFIFPIVIINQFAISYFSICCILYVDCFPGDYSRPTIPQLLHRNLDPVKVPPTIHKES